MREPPRPEMETFRALGAARGWRRHQCSDDETSDFRIETSETDEVVLTLNDHGESYGGLCLTLEMFPENSFQDAAPDQMAATIARWLRDAADAVEGKSFAVPAPAPAMEATHA